MMQPDCKWHFGPQWSLLLPCNPRFWGITGGLMDALGECSMTNDPAKVLNSSSSVTLSGHIWAKSIEKAWTNFNQASCRFRPFLTKNSEKSNRKKILPTSWRSQTPSKTPSMHPPDQAKHNKSSLDANGRLEVIFYGVLCIDQAKNRRWRLNYSRLPPDCPIGSRSGKSAPPSNPRLSRWWVLKKIKNKIMHTTWGRFTRAWYKKTLSSDAVG